MLSSNRQRLGAFIALVFAVVFIAPIWLGAHPPAMDLPGHLANATVLANHDAPAFQPFFEVPTVPQPNTLYYFLVAVLGALIPLTIASKLVLSLVIMATPASLWFARRAAGLSPEAALIGFPLAWTFNTVAGFIGFSMALPLMLFCAGLAHAQIRKPSWARFAGLAVLLFICFLAHAQVFLFTVGTVGLVALIGIGEKTGLPRPGIWRFVCTTAPALPSIAMAVPWYLGRLEIMERAGGASPKYAPAKVMIEYLPIHTFDSLNDRWDTRLACALLLAALVCAFATVWSRRERRPAESGRVVAYWLCALTAAITYFMLPSAVRFQHVINGRQAVVVLLFVVAALPFRITYAGPRTELARWAGGIAIALSLAYGVHFARATLAMNDELGDVASLMAIPEDGQELVATREPRSRVFRMAVFRHIGSYHVSANHGRVANTFGRWPIQPIRVTRAYGMPGYNPRSVARHYDWVLSGAPLSDPALSLERKTGVHWLYRVARKEKR